MSGRMVGSKTTTMIVTLKRMAEGWGNTCPSGHQQVFMSQRLAKTCLQFGCGTPRQSFQLDDKLDEQDCLVMVAEAPLNSEARRRQSGSRVMCPAHEKMRSCWAAGTSAGVVLEHDTKALQLPPLPPGQMHSSWSLICIEKRHRAAETLFEHLELEQLVG